ncbi:MAG: type II toxin-antitoxin system VapC family toxin [Candidatus Aenigmarchaeota archaeon]|nr:type II toxin-antitoxin system VapC family toxin [Candidatus Aenigmarchaeota archaeon]
MKIYLDTTVLAVFTYFKNIEKQRYESVLKLFEICKKNNIKLITSFYALHELFILPFNYFDKQKARKIGKEFIADVLKIEEMELIEFLSREKRLLYQKKFESIKDRTDIPHAISAFVERCDQIITYDSHFDKIADLIEVSSPEKFIKSNRRAKPQHGRAGDA